MNNETVKTQASVTDLASYKTRRETAASRDDKSIKMSVAIPTSMPRAAESEYVATICEYIVTYIEVKLDLIILIGSIDAAPIIATLTEKQRDIMFFNIMEKCMEHLFTDIELMNLLGTEQFVIDLDSKVTTFITKELQDVRSLL